MLYEITIRKIELEYGIICNMRNVWKKHIFTAELPYEKDQIVTLFLKERFEKANVFIMSLGQMSNIPPCRLLSYINGKLVKEKKYAKNNLNADGFELYFICIPKALFSTTFDLLRALRNINFTCDIFFAQHFLPGFIAIVLRRFGILRCEKIIFWMYDFFPIPTQFLRSLYYRGINAMQGIVRKNVDEIWYTTPRLSECDKNQFGELPKTVLKRLTHGCFFRRIKVSDPPPLPPMRLVFLGSLRKDTGIYESIDALENCIRKNMKVELLIIGSGPGEKYIKQYVRQKNLSHAVRFLGFEDRGEKIAKILSKCHLGIALYPTSPYSPNWYLTSGKCRRYISQKLPIVISTVPYFAKYIHDYNAGIVVDNNPEDIQQALQNIYNNPSILEDMRKGVDKLYNKYQADTILGKIFNGMIYSTKEKN